MRGMTVKGKQVVRSIKRILRDRSISKEVNRTNGGV